MSNENLIQWDRRNRLEPQSLRMPKRKRPPNNDEDVATTSNESEVDSSRIQPRNNDVLFGRGDCINRHPGNKIFRELVDSRKSVYLASCFKQEKRMIAESITSAVHRLSPPGRFLAKDPTSGLWHIVSDSRAREKTLQALREKAGSVKAQASAREPPRARMPLTFMEFPTFQSNPGQASLPNTRESTSAWRNVAQEAIGNRSGHPSSALSGSTGLRLAFANQTLATLSDQTNDAFAALSRQAPPPAPLPAFFDLFSRPEAPAVLAASNPGPAAFDEIDSTGRRRWPPESTAASPQVLPSSLPYWSGSGTTSVQHGPSSTSLPNADARESLMHGLQDWQTSEPPPYATNVPMTPRVQVTNNPLSDSPVSDSTFDALQRAAFSDISGREFFFAGTNHSFSPRRLPPGRDERPAPQQFQRQLDPSVTTARVQPERAATYEVHLPTELPLQQLQQTVARKTAPPLTVDVQFPETTLQPPQLLSQPQNPLYSPIRTRPTHEEPTPSEAPPFHALGSLPASSFGSPAMFHLFGPSTATRPPASSERLWGVPLPRAVLARRFHRPGQGSNTEGKTEQSEDDE